MNSFSSSRTNQLSQSHLGTCVNCQGRGRGRTTNNNNNDYTGYSNDAINNNNNNEDSGSNDNDNMNTIQPHVPAGHSTPRQELDIFYQITPITDYLFVSGARAVQFSQIINKDISCIINATVELPNLPIPNVDYMKVPIDDTPYSNLYSYFDVVADKINETHKRGGKTLVHCIAGISRSVSLCIAYLMKYEGMSLRKAYQHVKARRTIAHPNHGFFKQLIEYERRLFGQETVHMVHSPTAGFIPDVYEDVYRNLVWMTTYKQDYE